MENPVDDIETLFSVYTRLLGTTIIGQKKREMAIAIHSH